MCVELVEMCGCDMHVWAYICAHACGSVAAAPLWLYKLAQHQSPFGGPSMWALGGCPAAASATKAQLAELRAPAWSRAARLHFFMQQRPFRAALRAPLSQIRECGCGRGSVRGGAGAQLPWAGAAELGLGPRLRVTSL